MSVTWLISGIISGECLHHLGIKEIYSKLLNSYYLQWKTITRTSIDEKETRKLILGEGFTQLKLLGKLILMLVLLLLPFSTALFLWNLIGHSWINVIFSAHFILFGSIGIVLPSVLRILVK